MHARAGAGREVLRMPKGRAARAWEDTEPLLTSQDKALRGNVGEFRAGMTMDREEIERRADFLRGARLEESTRKSYRAWWATFIGFLKNFKKWGHIVQWDEVVMPVAVAPVADFLAYLAGEYAHSTIENALAAIAAVHGHYELSSPTSATEIKSMMKALLKAQTGVIKEKITFLPAHARAVMGLKVVWGEERKDGTRRRWTKLRVERAKVATLLGFTAWLRRSEVLRLDTCDVIRTGLGYDVRVKRAKNDTEGRGATTLIGGEEGDEAGLIDLIASFAALAGRKVSRRCTKATNCKVRCTECDFFFPRLGGTPQRPVTSNCEAEATSDFLTKDMRTMLRQLQRDGEESVQDMQIEKASAISLRRGGNSAAAALGISATFRRIHGRWKKDSCPDNEYLFLHKKQFNAIAADIMASKHGE